jgi:hypothetical protein
MEIPSITGWARFAAQCGYYGKQRPLTTETLMSHRLFTATLRPVNGQWEKQDTADLEWGPIVEDTEQECFEAFEAELQGKDLEFERTQELAGQIREERGRVYRLNGGESYQMVWTELNPEVAALRSPEIPVACPATPTATVSDV